ncbi:unnamed protein product [Gongylonema pulchrum]|uniref:GFO_IDH_MocA domain-containing protein n=1 Tax=Gongylonema pulchrum TaxID=637853 RepID=A0A183DGG3_9BILA|nr:unnamed protein product [Gongylonema pulchrum]
MIWGAGKVGRRFYRALKNENRRKVTAFCDIDEKKLHCGRYEYFDREQRRVTSIVPVIPLR